MTSRLLPAAVTVLLASSGFAAQAQDAPPVGQDWVLAHVPERKAVIALAEFDNGITLSSRCMDGVFEVTIHGLPEARGESRTLRIGVGGEPAYASAWTVGADRGAAFSRVPARLARELAKGGKLEIAVAGQRGQPGTRYVMELDPSSSAVEQTLTACGRPLVDPRDLHGDEVESGLPAGIVWDQPPRPTFPGSVKGRSPLKGFVTLSCVTRATGRLEDCVIESEHPGGFNLGRSVRDSLARARVRSTDRNVPLIDRHLMQFTVNFVMAPF